MSTIINPQDSLGNVASGIQALNGTAIDTNSGLKSAGTQRVVLATDQPQLTNAWKVDGSGVTQPVSGTVTANAGTGNFTIQGPVASGGTNANNPVKTGGVFNTTQPTVTTGQIVDLQTTARGAQIVATGVDTFNVTVNTALPSGTNTLGAVKLTDGTNALMGSAAAMADGATNPTLAGLQAYLMLYNGASWERARGDLGDASSPTGVLVNNPLLYNGATYDRQYGDKTNGAWVNVKSMAALPTGANTIGAVNQNGTWTVQPGNTANTTPWLMTPSPTSNSGWSFSYQSALTNSATQIKGTAGTFGGYVFLYNPNTTVTYIQVFNKASANVTLGTTTPDFVIPLPGVASASATGSGANLEITCGIAMGTGITVAATTTATGSTAPTNAVVATFLYK